MPHTRKSARRGTQKKAENYPPILLVEDSKAVSAYLSHKLAEQYHGRIDLASDYKEAQQLIKQHRDDYLLAVCDLHLPDATQGEIIALTQTNEVPAIIVTSDVEKGFQLSANESGVIEFILKTEYDYASDLVEQVLRFHQNQSVNVLVVDDSRVSRSVLKATLQQQNFSVISAANGKEALDIVNSNETVKVIITDYNMPVMDGLQLVTEVRRLKQSSEIAIIGISSDEQSKLGIKFIKHGASDFLRKPFTPEELVVRINHNVDILRYIDLIHDVANKDFLTGLYNRRFFFQQGPDVLAQHQEQPMQAMTILDIDFFKKINDQFGHDAGDMVLVKFAEILQQTFTDAICARLGGEEFAVLHWGAAVSIMDKVETARSAIESFEFTFENQVIPVTASFGTEQLLPEQSLDDCLMIADKLLYKAKDDGRNRSYFGKSFEQ